MTDLKLPTVGEMTFPQWQEWLVHYNALLLKRGRRIEELEAALVKIGVWNNFEDRYQGTINELIHNALEGKDD